MPSVVPMLLPNSKYTIILRNPIKLMYSAFWFLCKAKKLSNEQQLKGVDLFHKAIAIKLDMFNDCMKDTSTPSISSACKLDDKHTYASCIQQRLHLLDKCTQMIDFEFFFPELRNCGVSHIPYFSLILLCYISIFNN